MKWSENLGGGGVPPGFYAYAWAVLGLYGTLEFMLWNFITAEHGRNGLNENCGMSNIEYLVHCKTCEWWQNICVNCMHCVLWYERIPVSVLISVTECCLIILTHRVKDILECYKFWQHFHRISHQNSKMHDICMQHTFRTINNWNYYNKSAVVYIQKRLILFACEENYYFNIVLIATSKFIV